MSATGDFAAMRGPRPEAEINLGALDGVPNMYCEQVRWQAVLTPGGDNAARSTLAALAAAAFEAASD